MDWSDCPLVEAKPGVQRGRPMLKGTRMPAEDSVEFLQRIGGLPAAAPFPFTTKFA